MGEPPSPPTHIATYLLPLTLSGLEPTIRPCGPKDGVYSKAGQRPFATSEEASIISVDYDIGYQGGHKLFVHPSAFTSFLMNQTRAQSTLPVLIPWTSWGPELTRFMVAGSLQTFFGYNVAYTNNQLNFNLLDIARDLHRLRTSTQQDQSSCPQTFFDQDSPTTISANGSFKEDILTYLPYRWWGTPSEGSLVIPVEGWVYFTK